MKFSGEQQEKLYNILHTAFNRSELERLVRFKLGGSLDAIAGSADLSDVAFKLLEWAERNGMTGKLWDAVVAAKPAHPAVKELKAELDGGKVETGSAPNTAPQTAPKIPPTPSLNFGQKAKITELMLDLPSLQDEAGILQMVQGLPRYIRNNISQGATNNLTQRLNSIIATTLNYENGFRELIQIVQTTDAAAMQLRTLNDYLLTLFPA
jgi:hypothetical protein